MSDFKEQFVVYLGEEIQACEESLERATEFYDSLPSGEGKRFSLRRSLIKEQILKEDKR